MYKEFSRSGRLVALAMMGVILAERPVGEYTHPMSILCLRFKTSKGETIVRIAAAKIEKGEEALTLKDEAGEVVGSVDKRELSAWWIEPDPTF